MSRAMRWAAGAVLLSAGACQDFEWGRRTGNDDGGTWFNRKSGETWTIECTELEGDDRRKLAEDLADALRRVSPLQPERVRVEHDDERSIVYYGSYSLNCDEHGSIILSDAIKSDMRFIRTLSTGEEQYPFFSARPIQQPTPDEGPPEWRLENSAGVYTLQVGYTHNTPTLRDRKRAAVEWVRDLRSRGHEAYYYHSPDRPLSIITVGTFDESAALTDEAGQPRYSDAVRAVQAKEDFAYNLENGFRVFRVREDGTRVAEPSFLVRIPSKKPAAEP